MSDTSINNFPTEKEENENSPSNDGVDNTQTADPTNPNDKTNSDPQNNQIKNNKWIQRIIIFLVIPILAILITWPLTHKNKTATQSNDIPKTNSNTAITTKNNDNKVANESNIYNGVDFTDSDGDSLPDWVEKEIGTKVDYPECSEITKELNSCIGFTDFESSSVQLDDINIIFLLDASGSMAANNGVNSRMDSAKTALKEYVQQYNNTKADVGLIAFGHKGSNSTSDKAISCSSIEEMYPIGIYDNQTFYNAIDSFQPVGWTPISDALRLAGDKLTFASDRKDTDTNLIVLITDGEETCGGDPSATARTLRESGLKVTVNVIALDTDDKANISLKSIATSGGGTFVSVDSKNAAKIFDEVRKVWRESNINFHEWVDASSCIVEVRSSLYNCSTPIKNKLVSLWGTFHYQDPNYLALMGIDPKYTKLEPGTRNIYAEFSTYMETYFEQIEVAFDKNTAIKEQKDFEENKKLEDLKQ